jgi:transcriptional regulator with XRE-family HTH domain
MRERIQKLIAAEGLTPSQFADAIGIQRSAVSHLLSGRNNPSYDIIVKILTRFKNVNPTWLLLGSGSMYIEVTSSVSPEIKFPETTPRQGAISEKYSIPDNSLPVDNNSSFSSQNEDQKAEKTEKISNKKLEKVILLYTDHSFEVFLNIDN